MDKAFPFSSDQNHVSDLPVDVQSTAPTPLMTAQALIDESCMLQILPSVSATANINIVEDSSGGILSGGTATNTLSIQEVSLTQSFAAGGTAEVFQYSDIEGVGGVIGAGTPNFIEYIESVGGITTGGQVNLIGDDLIADGGVLASGDDVDTLITEIVASGQSGLVGGSALVSVDYQAISQNVHNIIGQGGSVVDGDADASIEYNPVIQGQGVLVGGVPGYVESITALGGISLGGTAVHTVRLWESSTKGIIVGGSGILPDGCAGVSGTASVAMVYDFSVSSAGVAAAATSLVWASRIEISLGGSLSGGDADLTYRCNFNGSGGGQTGGDSTISQILPNTASGGVFLGGVANVNTQSNFRYTASGGMVLDGTTHWYPKFAFVSEGVVDTGGSATSSITSRVYVRYRSFTGIKVSGSANSNLILSSYRFVGSGKITLGGSASMDWTIADSTCEKSQISCISPYPKNHRVCVPTYFFAANNYRYIPRRGSNKGAVLPSITVCRQHGLLPPTQTVPY